MKPSFRLFACIAALWMISCDNAGHPAKGLQDSLDSIQREDSLRSGTPPPENRYTDSASVDPDMPQAGDPTRRKRPGQPKPIR